MTDIEIHMYVNYITMELLMFRNIFENILKTLIIDNSLHNELYVRQSHHL